MKISSNRITKLSKLAKLSLSLKEVEQLKYDLDNIISYINMLSKVNVENIEPMTHIFFTQLSSRVDKTDKVLGNKCLINCRFSNDNFIIVPKII
jgi:aspartyl-tRNA(Asn)/glutamyl-tRNA(Gln) amidotransferase subunit C